MKAVHQMQVLSTFRRKVVGAVAIVGLSKLASPTIYNGFYGCRDMLHTGIGDCAEKLRALES